MAASVQKLKIYGHWSAPNPWKVITVLKELGIPYDHEIVEFSDVKNELYTKINPNGRLPAMTDPNTGLTIWESGAIILYLVDQYDKEGKISFRSTVERYECLQWLMFQVSGQGPYFGQATWFARFHPEKLPSAIERYKNEVVRVIGVLDNVLADRQWLVGDKCTYADLSFITWAHIAKGLLAQMGIPNSEERFLNYSRWLTAMEARAAVTSVIQTMAKERAAHGLPP